MVITRLEKIREYLETELARLYQDLNAAETLHHGDSFSNERAELAMQAWRETTNVLQSFEGTDNRGGAGPGEAG